MKDGALTRYLAKHAEEPAADGGTSGERDPMALRNMATFGGGGAVLGAAAGGLVGGFKNPWAVGTGAASGLITGLAVAALAMHSATTAPDSNVDAASDHTTPFNRWTGSWGGVGRRLGVTAGSGATGYALGALRKTRKPSSVWTGRRGAVAGTLAGFLGTIGYDKLDNALVRHRAERALNPRPGG